MKAIGFCQSAIRIGSRRRISTDLIFALCSLRFTKKLLYKLRRQRNATCGKKNSHRPVECWRNRWQLGESFLAWWLTEKYSNLAFPHCFLVIPALTKQGQVRLRRTSNDCRQAVCVEIISLKLLENFRMGVKFLQRAVAFSHISFLQSPPDFH